MLDIPKILNTPDFLDTPLDYIWEEETSSHFVVDANNEKIGKALWGLNHKATFGLATALGEWVYWRLSKHTDRPKINLALEAQWAGIINQHYFFDWEFDEEYLSDVLEGPTWSMLKMMGYIRENYFVGEYFINKKVNNLVMLARYISPDKKVFDRWFNNTLKRAIHHFPPGYDYAEVFRNMDTYNDKVYDSTKELPIPRDFFWEEKFDYKKENTPGLLNDFLSSLDYESNQFLNPPKIMIEEGFEGTPYKYN